MKIILGNGINYNQFKDRDWENFVTHFNDNLKGRVLNMEDGILKKFVLELMPKIYGVDDLEEKLKYSDINYVVRAIEKDEWLNLTCSNGYFDKGILSVYWDSFNGYGNDQFSFDWIIKDEVLKTITSLSMIFFTCIHMLFNDSIYDTLSGDYRMEQAEYSDDFISFLSGFDEVITLNVDGVLNKTLINGRYPHGFLNYKSPKSYYEDQMKKVNELDIELFNEFASFAKTASTNPYEILFNDSSKSKEEDIEFANQLESHNLNDKYKVHPLHKDVQDNWNNNKNMNNIDLEFYKEIDEWSGDVLIVGVSLKGDEVIFSKIITNESITKAYYYGDINEFEKIVSDKFVYCGFWSDNDYMI